MFIRLWAPTDLSEAAATALLYARALIRFEPVRLVTTTNQLEGPWQHMHRLLETPMVTPMVNVVCDLPERWTRTVPVGMPASDTMQATIASGKPQTTKVDVVNKEIELWTHGVRNVLFALDLAKTPEQAATANKYDAVIMPTIEQVLAWSSNQARLAPGECVLASHIPSPPAPEVLRILRAAVMGRNHD